MSLITLQYGQCGNQIGAALFSSIYEDLLNHKAGSLYHSQAFSQWFNVSKNDKWEPRSILIDSEIKAVDQIRNCPLKFKNVVARSYGSCANNWAYGYSIRSKLLIDEIVDTVRTEIEKCDFLSSFLNIFSSSGGTGSGIGSYVLECLKNEYSKKVFVNVVVLPFLKGEVIVQSYNTMLTLTKIYSLSDSVILFENDRLHYNILNSLNAQEVNFCDINKLIAQQLMSVLHPIKDVNSTHVLANLNAHPSFKFLQIRSVPLLLKNDECNMKTLLTSIARQSRFDFQQQTINKLQLKHKYIAAALISRGNESLSEQNVRTFRESNCAVCWLPQQESLRTYWQNKKIFSLENYLTCVSNNNSICIPINVILNDARNLFVYGAYLHHYKKFGVGTDYFKNSFEQLENILLNYKNLL